MNVGGLYYTQQVDNATNANNASTIVKRDANGAFAGNLLGSSSNTYALINSQNFSISGGDISASAQSFNGTSAVTLNASLNSVPGLSAGVYGGTTSGSTTIPVVTVAANGRIMAIANTTATSSLSISDTANSNTIYSGATFYHKGANGIVAVVSANTVTYYTDNTVLRSNVTTPGLQTISTDLTVAGNLIVSGTQTIVNSSTVMTQDSLIKLASNNVVGDVVDIGFYGQSNTGASIAYHGLIREGSGGTSAGNFYLFKNLATDPTGNTVNYSGLSKASLIADLSLSSGYALANIAGMATGANTFLSNPTSANFAALVTDETGTGQVVMNTSPVITTPTLSGTTTAGSINSSGTISANQLSIGTLTYSAAQGFASFQASINSYSQVILQNSNTGSQASVDFIVSNEYSQDSFLYGDFGMNGPNFTGVGSLNLPNAVYLYADTADLVLGTSHANAIHFVVNNGSTDALKIDANGFISTSQALSVPYGGTGQAYWAVGQLLAGNGSSSLVSIANSTFTATGTGASNNTVTSLTVDAYGRTTGITYSQILGLTVPQGGTGVTSFTSNGIVFGNGSGAMQVTAAAGTSDQTWSNQILTVTNAGVPIWSSALDGGSF
jgi:hypothetical protein